MKMTHPPDALTEHYARLLDRLRRKGGKPALDAAQQARDVPFAGWYETTFTINPMEFVQDDQPARVVSIPVRGEGSAQHLGPSAVLLSQVVDFTEVPPRSEASLVFEAAGDAKLYATGELCFTTPDREGQAAYAGALLIRGGKGRYRTARGLIVVAGTIDRVRGVGTLSFNGTLSFSSTRSVTVTFERPENAPSVSTDRSR